MAKHSKKELTPRRTARILALLSISQIRKKINKPEDIDINDLLLGAIRTLTMEVKSTIETASDELNRSHNQLLQSETRANNLDTARNMLKESITLTQKAINSLGEVIEIPTFVQLSHQKAVKEYAIKLISLVRDKKQEINSIIDEVMVDWTLNRLTQIDGNIIRIAVAEMLYLNLEHRVAIDEAVEIAKEYSDDDGYRFINGVLRKVSDKLTTPQTPNSKLKT
jgi:N utilization substance protein B